jgi:hypothetical protein
MPDARASRKRQIQVTPGLFGGGAAAGVTSGSIPHPAEQVTPLLFKASHSIRRWDAAPTKGLGAGFYIKRHPRPKRMYLDPGALWFLASRFPGRRRPKLTM